MAALELRRGRFAGPPPLIAGGPSFRHEETRFGWGKIEDVADSMTRKINIVDTFGALARQSDLHPAY